MQRQIKHSMTCVKILFSILSVALTLTIVGCTPYLQSTSEKKSEAIQIESIQIENKQFLIAKIDTNDFKLQIIENREQKTAKSIGEIQKNTSADLAFNGSFFDKNFTPLGLLVSEGHLLSPLNKSKLMNGIFTIDNRGQARLFDFETFEKKQQNLLPNIDFAIQSGPILLDQRGEIVINKKNNISAGRTTIGLDKNDNIVVLILRQSILNHENALTLYDFAKIAREHKKLEPLGLHSLINLDGGGSSGIANKTNYFPELEHVQHVITAVNKKKYE